MERTSRTGERLKGSAGSGDRFLTHSAVLAIGDSCSVDGIVRIIVGSMTWRGESVGIELGMITTSDSKRQERIKKPMFLPVAGVLEKRSDSMALTLNLSIVSWFGMGQGPSC